MSNSGLEKTLVAAINLLEQGKSVEAETMFRTITHQYPELEVGHFFLAASLVDQNLFAEAESPARVAVRLNPTEAGNIMLLGRCLMRQNKLVEAESCFRKGSEMEPDNRQYYEEWTVITQLEPFRSRLAEQRLGR
jgi:Flp pilus assembly protein TadD